MDSIKKLLTFTRGRVLPCFYTVFAFVIIITIRNVVNTITMNDDNVTGSWL